MQTKTQTQTDLNIVKLIEKNPLIRLNKTYESKLINKIKDNFNDSEQQLFVASFYLYLNYNSKNDFVIDFDNIWKWIGFTRKSDGKRVLEKNFIEKVDFIVSKAAAEVAVAAFEEYNSYENEKGFPVNTGKINEVDFIGSKTHQTVENKNTGGAGKNKEKIMLTVNTFKKFCLKANTKKAEEIHEYYIKLEELLQETLNEETEELRLQLENKNIQLKTNQNELKIKNKEIKNLHTLVKKKYKKRYSYSHCVYLIQNPDIKNKYKIGMTSDRTKRLDALGPGAPNPYDYVYFKEVNNALEAKAFETLLLGIFDKYRLETQTRGGKLREWVSDIDLNLIKKEMDDIVNVYNSKKEFYKNKFYTDNNISYKERQNIEYNNHLDDEVDFIEEDELSDQEEYEYNKLYNKEGKCECDGCCEGECEVEIEYEYETDSEEYNLTNSTKTCYQCKEEKNIDEYYDRTENSDCKEGICKPCFLQNKKVLKQEKDEREIIVRPEGTKKCRKCSVVKEFKCFLKHSTSKDGYEYKCIDCKKTDATNNITNKTCYYCKINKTIDKFNVFRLGYNKFCKECENKENNKEKKLDENTKKCSKCKLDKPLDNFPKKLKSYDGYHNYCSDCGKQISKQNRDKRKKQNIENQINNEIQIEIVIKNCNTCKNEKPISSFYKDKSSKDGYRASCKDCQKNNDKELRISKTF